MLIERHHKAEGRISSALYSDCDRYRYALTRTWDADAPRLLYIMLNPSKATETQNDPTIERCERRARALGFGAFRAVNIFAWRETDPGRLRRAPDPIGPENDTVLRDSVAKWLARPDDIALCAWGIHGAHLNRGAEVASILGGTERGLYALGTTKAGDPRHPLYMPYAARPEPWSPPAPR